MKTPYARFVVIDTFTDKIFFMPVEMPPYVGATGLLQDLFTKIKEAPPPPRFSQDFLFSNLKFKKSGSTIPFIPFLKRLGFLSNDGTPTEIYKKFRNPDPNISGQAMAQAFQFAFSQLYSRNEYWHTLSKDALKNFLIEVLEVEANNGALKFLINTIEVLKRYTDFSYSGNSGVKKAADQNDVEDEAEDVDSELKKERKTRERSSDLEGVNLSYTINLNLPETSDITVFDAIFKSLKANLLNK